ncbi:MAG TPA: peptidoglycan bridge formation glycyltransferase FemA/FemB family protein [Candidatus Pacearchaeota archaeon]|mgnify:CR=1 FL=1|nr:peptidoglycan bridge formation glycyltransferase FemA/FemB family protein [Candidatus Pacearchaeota archaeon]
MLYNYFSTKKFNNLRESLGFEKIDDSIFLCCPKYNFFIDKKIIFNILKIISPEIIISKDLSLAKKETVEDLIKKNRKVSGYSFIDNLYSDLLIKKTHYTSIIDISKSIEEIYKSFDNSLKKNIRKAENNGFFVKKAEDIEDFNDYYNLLKKFRDNLGFRTDSYDTAKKMWDILHNSTNESNYEVFLCLDINLEILSAMGVITNKEDRQLIEVSIARSQKSIKEKLTDNELLKWEIIKWAKNNNFTYYDLAGINIEAKKDTKEYNIARYKKNWGGATTPMYFYRNK